MPRQANDSSIAPSARRSESERSGEVGAADPQKIAPGRTADGDRRRKRLAGSGEPAHRVDADVVLDARIAARAEAQQRRVELAEPWRSDLLARGEPLVAPPKTSFI